MAEQVGGEGLNDGRLNSWLNYLCFTPRGDSDRGICCKLVSFGLGSVSALSVSTAREGQLWNLVEAEVRRFDWLFFISCGGCVASLFNGFKFLSSVILV